MSHSHSLALVLLDRLDALQDQARRCHEDARAMAPLVTDPDLYALVCHITHATGPVLMESIERMRSSIRQQFQEDQAQ